MIRLTRRDFARSTVAAAAAALAAPPLARPAYAAGSKITVWWNQGFFPGEDQAVRDAVSAWEKQSGNTVDISFYATGDIPTKIISAITAGDVPDICYADLNDFAISPQQAWKGNLLDVSDVVATQEKAFSKTALLSCNLYNQAEKKRSFYAVPLKQQALHNFYWRPMIDQAGYKDADIPKDWNGYWDFFIDVQKKLRGKGQRVYGLGFTISTKDSDTYYLFNQVMRAYGGKPVSESGKLIIDQPENRKAAVETLEFLRKAYAAGAVPPGAINWGDPDNNAALYAKQVVSTPNASLSIPVAKKDDKQFYYHDIVTNALPTAPDGKPVTSLVAVKSATIPKGARNAEAAKDFLRYLIQPAVIDKLLTTSQGRWFPVMPQLVKDDPFWTNKDDPHIPVAAHQMFDEPTEAWPMEFNPAYADVNVQQVWGKATAAVLTGGTPPDKAADAAIQQIHDIFANYPI